MPFSVKIRPILQNQIADSSSSGWEPAGCGITRTNVVRYAGAAGDFNPMHHDDTIATQVGNPSVFGHGMLTAGLMARVVKDWFGPEAMRRFQVRFAKQVWPGDTITFDFEKRELRLEYEDYQPYRVRVGLSPVDLTYDRGIMAFWSPWSGSDLAFQVVNGQGLNVANDARHRIALRASRSQVCAVRRHACDAVSRESLRVCSDEISRSGARLRIRSAARAERVHCKRGERCYRES